jgi:transcriptional regulator with XRE-family HTH domain
MRETAGLTQKAAAARVGIGQSTLAEIETGRRSPSIEQILDLLDSYRGRLEALDVRDMDPTRARVKRQRGRPRIPTDFYYAEPPSADRLLKEASAHLLESRRWDAIGRHRQSNEAAARAVAVVIRWHGVRLQRRAPDPREGFLDYVRATGLVTDVDAVRIAEGLLDSSTADDPLVARLLMAIAEGLLPG